MENWVYDESFNAFPWWKWVISEGHNWAKIKQLTGGILSTLRNMKFEMPDDEDSVSVKVSSSPKRYYWYSLTLQQYNSFLRTISENFVSISTSESVTEKWIPIPNFVILQSILQLHGFSNLFSLWVQSSLTDTRHIHWDESPLPLGNSLWYRHQLAI